MLGLLFQQALNAHRAGAPDKACKLYQAVLQMAPGHFDALHFLGLALSDIGQILQGAHYIEQALQRNPRSAPALSNLASLYRRLGRPGEARQTYERALTLDPGFAEALNGLGNLFHQEKDYLSALRCFEAAINSTPDFAEAYNNKGNTLFALRRLDEAVKAFHQAISLRPGYAEAFNNLGFSLVALRHCEEALSAYAQALKLAPDYDRAKLNLGLCHLLMGNYSQGWPLYEFRWADQQRTLKRNFPETLWRGKESLTSKTIFLHAEQGLGDTLQFCRYIPMVARLADRVIVEIPQALRPLLETIDASVEFIENGEPLPGFDLHCPLASLPLAFATESDSVPTHIPYLSASPEKSAAWNTRLSLRNGQPRIGLVWAGSQADPHRAIPPELLIRNLPPQTMIVAVQKELSETECQNLREQHPDVLLCGEQLNDFSDTAALLSNLDLLITIDTSVAHLAGAIGCQAWVLLHTGSDWRWRIEGATTPWYPSLRLFRQKQAGDWQELIEQQLMPALDAFIRNFPLPKT